MDVVANIVKLGVSAKTVIDKSNAHYTTMHSRKNDFKKILNQSIESLWYYVQGFLPSSAQRSLKYGIIVNDNCRNFSCSVAF